MKGQEEVKKIADTTINLLYLKIALMVEKGATKEEARSTLIKGTQYSTWRHFRETLTRMQNTGNVNYKTLHTIADIVGLTVGQLMKKAGV